MKIRLAAPLQTHSYADGKGIRMVIWNQGCKIACPGCHNPETHSMCGGKEVDIEDLEKEIIKNSLHHQGITLSGGDPFLQPEQNKRLAILAHSIGLDVWAYCGQTYEQLLQDESKRKLLEECDVLIDGPFVLGQRDIRLAFRGSTNQRLIDVQKSINQGKVVLYE